MTVVLFVADTWSYVIPDVGTRYLSDAELDQFSGLYLMLARNEIYARHGYVPSSNFAQAAGFLSLKK